MHTLTHRPRIDTDTPHAATVAHIRRLYPEETVYILDRDKLRDRYQLFRDHFLPEHEHAHVSYAMKANPHPHVMRTLFEAGMTHVDCASLREIQYARNISRHAEPYFNHPIKRERDIRDAYEHGVRSLTIQDRSEADKILRQINGELGAEIVVRMATADTGASINLSSKFGVPDGETHELLRYLQQEAPHVARGVAIHVGSQIGSTDAYKDHMPILAQMHDMHRLSSINLGGGMPAEHAPNESHDMRQFVREISHAVRTHCQAALADNVTFTIEPGRGMVAEAIDMYIPVLQSTHRGNTPCVYMNEGIFGSFTDHAVHAWPYHFDIVRPDGSVSDGEYLPHTLFGNTCDSGDAMHDVLLPADVAPRDYLYMRHAGAYTDAQRTQFNGIPTARHIFRNDIFNYF